MAYLGEEIPKLGFGLMRLPMIGLEIDVEQTKTMVDMFLAKGFKYFDTAYGYQNGKSEEAIKAALVDRYPRESFLLATKLPAWAAQTKEEAQQMFYTSLERTGAGYFDFYLLHNLGAARTEAFDQFEIWDFVKKRKEEGLIKHIGFSMHDSAEALEKLLQEHPEVEFVQLQINYIDWESPSVQSRKCYEVARKYNKPIVVMEPVKGGNLASLQDDAEKLFKDYDPEASLPSWAIRFVASHEGLITVLSGMSDISQMENNLSFMENFKPLSEEEYAVIDKVVDKLNQNPSIPCTGCSYCTKGCPQKVRIPSIFKSVNLKYIFGNETTAKHEYAIAVRFGVTASDCIACGQCEAVCPQHIHIIDELKRCAEFFD